MSITDLLDVQELKSLKNNIKPLSDNRAEFTVPIFATNGMKIYRLLPYFSDLDSFGYEAEVEYKANRNLFMYTTYSAEHDRF